MLKVLAATQYTVLAAERALSYHIFHNWGTTSKWLVNSSVHYCKSLFTPVFKLSHSSSFSNSTPEAFEKIVDYLGPPNSPEVQSCGPWAEAWCWKCQAQWRIGVVIKDSQKWLPGVMAHQQPWVHRVTFGVEMCSSDSACSYIATYHTSQVLAIS